MFSNEKHKIEFSSSLKDMKAMSKTKQNYAQQEFDFRSFDVKKHNYKIAAVDGSNNNIQGINFQVAILRAGYLIYQYGQLVEERISPIKMETLINSQDKENGYYKKYRDYYYELTKEIPGDYIEFEKASERLRTLLEWQTISFLVDTLDEGDIVIFDGSLISGTISTNHDYYDNLVTKAKNKGVILIGLSKDTGLSIEGVPIPNILREASNKQYPNKNWYVELEDTYFVKFEEDEDLIFRFDVVLPDNIDLEEALSRVGAYTGDADTYGYPYPMQNIHDEVRISNLDKEDCFETLKSEWIEDWNPQNSEEYEKAINEFEELFFNYHKQLDLISYGR